jgi:hypothetical protein
MPPVLFALFIFQREFHDFAQVGLDGNPRNTHHVARITGTSHHTNQIIG